MSAKKLENRITWLSDDSSSSGEDRQQIVEKLRSKVERFCDCANTEEIEEATRIVRSLLVVRGLLPDQTSKKIN